MATLTLSVLELALLLFGAILLGAVIYYLINNRSKPKISSEDLETEKRRVDEWKHRYRNDLDIKESEISKLRIEMKSMAENTSSYTSKIEEQDFLKKKAQDEIEKLRNQNKELKSSVALLESELEEKIQQIEAAANAAIATPKVERTGSGDYLDQLQEAQQSLIDQNNKINALLGNIDVIKEAETRQRQILNDNEELHHHIEDLQQMLANKEKEIENIQRQGQISAEMSSMLEAAQTDFQILKDKIGKLESQASLSRSVNMEYEDLKESHMRLIRDYEEQKNKLRIASNDNQHFQQELGETEEKLAEANFQRQQLQKKVVFLEELTADLQTMLESNKNLEEQIRRVGELESMLNVVSEERDELMRQQER